MAMAQIFKPIRWPPAALAADKPEAAVTGRATEPVAQRQSRVGAQPVTNTLPPGPAAPGPDRETAWLALIEMVFEVTGWPDAEAE